MLKLTLGADQLHGDYIQVIGVRENSAPDLDILVFFFSRKKSFCAVKFQRIAEFERLLKYIAAAFCLFRLSR